jgi:hypothetical protein
LKTYLSALMFLEAREYHGGSIFVIALTIEGLDRHI